MEPLTLSLKEVQKAKGNLESRLHEKRQKRKAIERVLETVNAKLTQITDIHTKMAETMKIGQHKVAQTQAQSDSMERSNGEKRHNLQSVNQKIKDLHDVRTYDMHTFEDELNKMAKQMMNTKDFHTDENLLEKISKSKEEYNHSLMKSKQLNEEKASVNQYLVKLEEQTASVDKDIDKQTVIDILTEEQNNMLKHLEKLKEETDTTRDNLQQSS